MKRPSFPVLLLLLISACTKQATTSAQKSVSVSPTAASNSLALGSIFAGDSGSFLTDAKPCIKDKGRYRFIPYRSLDLKSHSDYSMEDVYNELEVEGSVRFNYFPLLEVSGVITNRTALASNDSKLVIFHDITYNAGTLMMERPIVDEAYVNTIPAAQLKSKCGSGALTKVQLGARATVGLEFLINGKKITNYLKAVLAGRLSLGFIKSPPVTITLANGYLVNIEDVNVSARIFVDQHGGNEKAFEPILRMSGGPCRIRITATAIKDIQLNQDFQDCLARFDRVVDYFKNCFQNSINIDKDKVAKGECNNLAADDTPGPDPKESVQYEIEGNEYLTGFLSKRSNLVPISYGVADYSELGLLSLAQNTKVVTDERIRASRKRLLKTHLGLSAVQSMLVQIRDMDAWIDFVAKEDGFQTNSDITSLIQVIEDLKTSILASGNPKTALAICVPGQAESCEAAELAIKTNLDDRIRTNPFLKRHLAIN